MKKNVLSKRIIFYDMTGFGIVICLLWLNEVIDIPYLFLGAKATPINITESIFETLIVTLLCIVVTLFSIKLIKKIKYLEGFLRVCSFCKKINIEEDWVPIEDYIRDHSEAELSHGLCPKCADKHYGHILNSEE